MPSITSFAHASLSNLGPLTATYTAPASCYTGTSHIDIGVVEIPDAPIIFEYSPDCTGAPLGDCVPSGAAWDSIAQITKPADGNAVNFYSPGVVCPSNWATVGVVERATGGSYSPSGAFSTTTAPGSQFFDPPLNILMNALDPGETAIACCPSKWQLYGGAGGVCYSTLPASVYKPTVGCQRLLADSDITDYNTTYAYLGHTVTADLEVVIGTTSVPPSTTTFAPTATTYVGASILPAILLVHQSGDTALVTTGSSTPTSGSGTAPKSTNGATSVRKPGGGLSSTWAFACLAASLAGGALLMLH